jgi:hypothetical protein
VASFDEGDAVSVIPMFDVELRIVAADGSTVVHEFGTSIVSITEPGDSMDKIRVDAPRVDGDTVVAEKDSAGDLQAVIVFEGASWAAVETAYQAARTAWRSESRYYLDVVREGVTKRYRADRPDSVSPDRPDLLNRRQTYAIRWHVQPNPTVVIA